MRSLLLLPGLLGITFAATGFDEVSALSVSNFQCMSRNGHSFFISRVFRSSGQIDTAGIQNIKNAWTGGMSHVDAYVFPCVTCSTSAAAQAQSVVNALTGVSYGIIWIDVEIYKWSSNLQTNRDFITQMGNQFTASGVSWGILTNANSWKSIVGLEFTALSNLPLWWASFNGQANFNNFQPFAGWTRPAIHQYSGNVAGPCGFNTNLNYEP